MSCDCMGCQYEIMGCYDWQKRGYDAGLEFSSHKNMGIIVLFLSWIKMGNL